MAEYGILIDRYVCHTCYFFCLRFGMLYLIYFDSFFAEYVKEGAQQAHAACPFSYFFGGFDVCVNGPR